MYNREKMLTAVLYILKKMGGLTDWHTIHKTFYTADKKSLVDNGRMISDNTYIRMQWGPVPSELDYLLEALRADGAHTTYFGRRVTELLAVNGKNHVTALVEPDLRYLSKSDLHCLDYAVSICKGLDFEKRTSLTHDYAWNNAKKNGVAIRAVDILVAAGGGKEGLEYHQLIQEAEAAL